MTTPYRVQVQVRTTAVSTGVPVVCEWTQGADNWGTAIESDGRDWTTTDEHTEESNSMTSANTYYTWEIDPSALDFTKTLYVRFRDTTENSTNIKNCAIASQNNSTTAYRPQLIITFANPNPSGPPIRLLASLGVG